MPIERLEMDHELACFFRFSPFFVGFLQRLKNEIHAPDSLRSTANG
jgi:hypothetical protein